MFPPHQRAVRIFAVSDNDPLLGSSTTRTRQAVS
jgi:hypothetical protein